MPRDLNLTDTSWSAFDYYIILLITTDRFGIKAVQAPSRLATSVLQAQGGVREDFEAGDKTDRNLLE